MACFIVPMLQAAATSAWRKRHESAIANPASPALMRHIPTLEKMLWGGTVVLIVDHIISGELTWKFPFLTALGTEGGTAVVLREMLTVGVPMSLVLTLVWMGYALLKERAVSRATL